LSDIHQINQANSRSGSTTINTVIHYYYYCHKLNEIIFSTADYVSKITPHAKLLNQNNLPEVGATFTTFVF